VRVCEGKTRRSDLLPLIPYVNTEAKSEEIMPSKVFVSVELRWSISIGLRLTKHRVKERTVLAQKKSAKKRTGKKKETEHPHNLGKNKRKDPNSSTDPDPHRPPEHRIRRNVLRVFPVSPLKSRTNPNNPVFNTSGRREYGTLIHTYILTNAILAQMCPLTIPACYRKKKKYAVVRTLQEPERGNGLVKFHARQIS
jgi:hypothetical protein